MNARAAAILATRLIGLLMLLYGGAQLAGQFVAVLQYLNWLQWDLRPGFLLENLPGRDEFGLSLRMIGLALACLVLGWYLLFRGRRVHGWLLAGLGSECGKCGYSLRGVTGGKCPECGEGIERGDG